MDAAAYAKSIGAIPVEDEAPQPRQDPASYAKSVGGIPETEEPPHENMLEGIAKSAGQGVIDAGKGMYNLATSAGSGLINAVEHPLDTTVNISNAMGGIDTKNATADALRHPINSILHPIDTAESILSDRSTNGEGIDDQGIQRTLRNIPVVGETINRLSGVSSEQRADQAASDAQHEKDHPLTDFIQKNAGLAVLPEGAVNQIGLLAADTFHKSLLNGNSAYDAMKEAAHTAALAGTTIGGGKALSAAPDLAMKLAAKEAKISPDAMSRYRVASDQVNEMDKYVKDPESFKNIVDAEVAPINAAVDINKGLVETARDDVRASQQPATALGREIPEHIDAQLRETQKQSGQAFDILAENGESFNDGKLRGVISSHMNSLKIGGVVPTVGPIATAYKALDQFRDFVKEIGAKTQDGQIPAGVVKELIQNLDSVSEEAYQRPSGGLSPKAAGELAAVRKMFNKVLRESSLDAEGKVMPGSYAAVMDKLAPETGLVKDMSKMFGNEQSALSALKAAENPKSIYGHLVRQKVGEYDAMHGTDFGQRIVDYYDAPKQNLATAQEALTNAQGEAAAVNKIGKDSTQTVLKSIRNGQNWGAREQLEGLSPELAQQNMDIGVAEQFARPTINGSRRTNVGAYVLGGLGGTIGGFLTGDHGTGALIGGAIGGAVGGLADIYGGQAVKAALDAGIKLDRFKANSPYIKPLMEAAQESPKALSVAHYILSQTSPEYQETQK